MASYKLCRLASPSHRLRNIIIQHRRVIHDPPYVRRAVSIAVQRRSRIGFAAVAGAWNKYMHGTLSDAGLPVVLARHCSLFSSNDTVFALSSGHGKCGVAVVRASGPHALQALMKITRLKTPPKPRHALLRKLTDPQSGDTVDHGLILWFPAPDSFTGEDSVEFQIHGGPSVVLALLNALAKIPGCRHAEPGDFTKRAFFNNKLDLTGVEGLADLIHAETEAQRKQALRQMELPLSPVMLEEHGTRHKGVLQLLTHSVLTCRETWADCMNSGCVAHVEATIDFGEDENIEEGLVDQVRDEVEVLLRDITDHLNDGRRGERLRSGVHVAIVGAPNAGKSSLLNIMCQRPAAIVSSYAGTTRDVLESALDIFGYPIVLSDTAGLRIADDPVEQEGVRRALKRAETADLKILIADCSLHTELLQTLGDSNLLLSDLARKLLGLDTTENDETWMAQALEAFTPEDTIVVLNKTDLLPAGLDGSSFSSSVEGVPACWISCKSNAGIGSFMEALKRQLEQLCGNPLAGNPSLTQARHRQHLSNCSTCLDNFLDLGTGEDFHLDMAAEELRAAIRQLGRVTGKVGVEEILDVVFRDFCIGK